MARGPLKCGAQRSRIGCIGLRPALLEILGFTDFRPVLFVTKCHTNNYSQIFYFCNSFFWQYSFSRHQRFMTTGEDRNKDRSKNWKLYGLWKLPFRQRTTQAIGQQLEGRTSCVMWFFRDMSHSNKSTHSLWIKYFFIIGKMCFAAGWNGFAGRILTRGPWVWRTLT